MILRIDLGSGELERSHKAVHAVVVDVERGHILDGEGHLGSGRGVYNQWRVFGVWRWQKPVVEEEEDMICLQPSVRGDGCGV